ncbi:MAG: pseudouridine-5'-phosphate glycosidase, partial [Tagaea sp.]|nr:pseudouridine-5'-phosphate glycosidase [Tagaea sp.]
VVALESTIVAHGLPRPANLDAGRALEAEVRGAGAIPATIAILGGRICVGLSAAQMETLALTDGIAKASRRDLAALIAKRANGATTVAATMAVAAMAGIAIFATGGIGGVHRGAETSFDISADLPELARSPVAVISAGAKSILDLPKTLETLETLGVPVWGWRTHAFPAFYAPDSGLRVEARFDAIAELARAVAAHRRLGGGGMLIANPIPAEAALDIEPAIAEAVAAADAQGIGGKALTPFLLARINARTEGRSLAANLALARNNARLGGELAVALAQSSS